MPEDGDDDDINYDVVIDEELVASDSLFNNITSASNEDSNIVKVSSLDTVKDDSKSNVETKEELYLVLK